MSELKPYLTCLLKTCLNIFKNDKIETFLIIFCIWCNLTVYKFSKCNMSQIIHVKVNLLLILRYKKISLFPLLWIFFKSSHAWKCFMLFWKTSFLSCVNTCVYFWVDFSTKWRHFNLSNELRVKLIYSLIFVYVILIQ